MQSVPLSLLHVGAHFFAKGRMLNCPAGAHVPETCKPPVPPDNNILDPFWTQFSLLLCFIDSSDSRFEKFIL
jgi:hypothetical protein